MTVTESASLDCPLRLSAGPEPPLVKLLHQSCVQGEKVDSFNASVSRFLVMPPPLPPTSLLCWFLQCKRQLDKQELKSEGNSHFVFPDIGQSSDKWLFHVSIMYFVIRKKEHGPKRKRCHVSHYGGRRFYHLAHNHSSHSALSYTKLLFACFGWLGGNKAEYDSFNSEKHCGWNQIEKKHAITSKWKRTSILSMLLCCCSTEPIPIRSW